MREQARVAYKYNAMVLAAGLLAASAQAMTAAQSPADFTGTWTLDLARSQGLPEGMSQAMTVEHTGDRIEIETTVSGPAGEQRLKDVYMLDGKETEYVVPVIGDGSGKGKRTSRWLPGKNGFEASETATLTGPEGDVEVTASRRWTLAPDGKTLTIEMTTSGLQGQQQSRRVFVRR